MHTATISLQSESDVGFMGMDKIRALRDKTNVVVMVVTNLKQRELVLDTELRRNSKPSMAV